LRSKSGPASVAEKLLSQYDMPVLDLTREDVVLPTSDSDPIPFLEVQLGKQVLGVLENTH
jgi:hypothetical protein